MIYSSLHLPVLCLIFRKVKVISMYSKHTSCACVKGAKALPTTVMVWSGKAWPASRKARLCHPRQARAKDDDCKQRTIQHLSISRVAGDGPDGTRMASTGRRRLHYPIRRIRPTGLTTAPSAGPSFPKFTFRHDRLQPANFAGPARRDIQRESRTLSQPRGRRAAPQSRP